MNAMSEDVQSEDVKEEKTFTQDELNAIVGKTRIEAGDRARRQAEQDYQKQVEAKQMEQQPPAQQQPQQSQDNQQMSPDAMYQKMQERFNQDREAEQQQQQQQQLEQQVRLAAQNYTQNMGKGKEKYADFDEVLSNYNPADPMSAALTYLVSGMDNAADVMYELSKSPDKLEDLMMMAQSNPDFAERRLKKLASSISTNENATNQARQNDVPAPLDRMQPSQVSSNSDGQTVRDLRKADWLRG